MAYTVFARKYRPQTFTELVGQEHVARTLGNAIDSKRVAHAFLFTGVRGVGKTTTARLLAKALNCHNGPTRAPCNDCDPCRDITAGVDMDVLEMDGASNNSVDDVRRLQETLPFRPSRDRFKIVIVDEVHMLSTGAFNAFLKTLEEPPPHVKFIFATTEIHKVPITIRSRCQRYDFRLIPQAIVAQRVKEILKAEEVTADEQAVAIVARESAGSMRDALTLLDQLVAFGGKHLVGEEVAQTLGIAARNGVINTAHALLTGDPAACISAVDQLCGQGVDPLHLNRQLLEVARDLVVLRLTDGSLVELAEEERAAAKKLAEEHDPLELQRAFAMLGKLADEVGRASAPKMVLEMGLARIATRPALRDLAQLMARVERLEKSLRGQGGTRRQTSRAPARRATLGADPQPSAAAAISDKRSFAMPPRASTAAPSGAPTSRPAPSSPTRSQQAPSAPAPSPAEAPAKQAEIQKSAPESPAPKSPAPEKHVQAPAELAASDSPPPTAPREATEAGIQLRRNAMQEWERIIELLRGQRPALAAILEHGVPRVVSADKIILSFKKGSFYARQARAPESERAILDAAESIWSARPPYEVRDDVDGDEKRTVASVEQTRRDHRDREKKKAALEHPRVLEALDVFPEARGSVDVRIEGD